MMYTFLFNHKNTICIRQSHGNTLEDAIGNWLPLLKSVKFGKGEDKTPLDLNLLQQELQDTRFVPLRELKNVWCAFMQFGGVNAIVNVVLTQGANEEVHALDDHDLA